MSPSQSRRKFSLQTVFLILTITLFGICLFSSFTHVQVIVQFDNPKSKLLGFKPTPSDSKTIESSLHQFTNIETTTAISIDTEKSNRIDEELIPKKQPKHKKDKAMKQQENKKERKHGNNQKGKMISSAILEEKKSSEKTTSQTLDTALVELMTEEVNPRLDIEVVNTSMTFPVYDNDPYPNAAWPRLAWLMSFPNSGTSFSIHAIRKLTQLCTGTNYVHESKDPHPTPIMASSPHGPYWIDLKRFPIIPEDSYVLTKTHCDGFCNANAKCKVQKYMINATQFQLGCLGQKESKNNTKNSPYSPELVARAIHLIRDPLDNIVSRFHLTYKKFTDEQKVTFTNDAIGFQAFCTKMDSFQHKSDKEGILTLFHRHDINATDLINIPCWSDFYRYVSWHNNAFQVKAIMHLPSITVYYEDYDESQGWNTTVSRMLSFLKQNASKTGKIHKFKMGKSYHDYYTMDQQLAIWKLIKILSLVDTWEILKRYAIVA